MSNPEALEQLSFCRAFESPDSLWDQIKLGKLVLPNQPGLPAKVSHLVLRFLLGSQTVQAFGRRSLNFLELLSQGIWHKLISFFTWLPFFQGLFHWFVAFSPPLFHLKKKKSPTY